MKYNPLTRRMFLQGLGGYTLAIPLLPSLLPYAEAQTVSNLRLSVVHSPMGRDPWHYYPKLTDNQFTTIDGVLAKKLSEIQGPMSHNFGTSFDGLRNKMSILRGLDGLGGGKHNTSLITAASAEDPRSTEGFGYSLDMILETSSKFYPIKPMTGALRVCPSPNVNYADFNRISWDSGTTRGRALPTEWNPQAVYNSLLNPNTVQTRAGWNSRIQGASSLVLDQYKRVMNGRRISAADKHRLEAYTELVNEVDKVYAIKPLTCGGVQDPGLPKTPSEVNKMMFKMQAAALACGVTKIAMHSIIFCDDQYNPDNQSWHDHAHGGKDSVNPATGRSFQSDYAKWTMELVAYYLNLLDSMPDTNGTLLDNTLFFYGNEDSTGGHEYQDLAIMVAGAKGKLRTGYMLDYRPRPLKALNAGKDIYAGRPYNNFLVSVFKAMGLGPSDYQRQGIPGFGRYDKPLQSLTSHYIPFLGTKVNDALPALLIG